MPAALVRRYNRAPVGTEAKGDRERGGERPGEASFAEVRAVALGEMLAMNDPGFSLARRALERVFDVPASGLARTLVELDRETARTTLREASLRILRRLGVTARLDRGRGGGLPTPLEELTRPAPRASGDEARTAHPVPAAGPLLIISNHPGLYDALTLFAAIGREDLRTLAARRPLLEALPSLRARLIAIDLGADGATAVRQAMRHLRAGGALLHFPAGRIEPDPRVTPEGTPHLATWQPGLEVLLAAAARTGARVMTAIVSGVVSRRALGLARLLRPEPLTDPLAPFLQTSLPGFADLDVRVRFGEARPAEGTSVDGLRAELEELAREASGLR